MGIAAVTSFVVSGVVLGAIVAVVALRKGERPGTVALFSASAITIASLMLIYWLFWASLDQPDWPATLLPDFFAPGRKDKILSWYGLCSAGLAGLVVAALGKLRKRGQQA